MTKIHLTDFQCSPSKFGRELSCRVVGGGLPDRLVYEVSGTDVPREITPTSDFALAALIYPAMMLGLDIEIEGQISHELLFAANGDLQALLQNYRPRLKRIHVDAEAAPPPSHRNKRCGTGYSAGVDTFATLSVYERSEAPISITDLAVFDVGAFGKAKTKAQRIVVERNVSRLIDAAKSRNHGWFSIETNLSDFYAPLKKSSFQKTHSIRNASAAMALQDVVGTYLYSSSYPYNDINSRNDDMAFIEPMLMPLLSTEHLRLVSAGAGFSRLEKMRIVADYPPAYDTLDICVAPAEQRVDRVNCSKCWKCLRAMLTFDALGKLDAFEKSFDIPYYRAHKTDAVRAVAISAAAGKPADRDVRALLAGTDLDTRLSLAGYVKAFKARTKDWIKSKSP